LPNIVIVNVTETVPPAPSKLQRTGALISTGGTNTPQFTLSLLTQPSDLTPLLASPAAITSLTWSSGVVTVVTAAPHGIPAGQQPLVSIQGAVPAGYNSTTALDFNVTVVNTTTFTYPLAVNPGAETTPGTWVLNSYYELQQMVTTFFGQPYNQSVYLLELGACAPDTALFVTNLSEFINNNPQNPSNPQSIYSYLLPRPVGYPGAPFQSYLSTFDSLTAKTYFFGTTFLSAYAEFLNTQKAGVFIVEAPSVTATRFSEVTEFSAAAGFAKALAYSPSSTTPVSPFCYSFLFGVTPYPLPNNGPTLAALATANINVVGTGGEGGISDDILLYGTTLDGNDFTYWYSVDWVQINADLEISNAIINGSNSNPPLYYNQQGINRLQAVVRSLMNQAIGDGLALGNLISTTLPAAVFAVNVSQGLYAGNVVVNAEPFTNYVSENPSNYAVGIYGGLSVAYTPARGFRQIIFNVNVSNFAGA
jgi:hypothetical protein